jgi:hypothetical protein
MMRNFEKTTKFLKTGAEYWELSVGGQGSTTCLNQDFARDYFFFAFGNGNGSALFFRSRGRPVPM